MAVLLRSPLDHTLTRPIENSHPKHKNEFERKRALPSAPTVELFCSGNIQQRDHIDEIGW
jgi:hypothetical protein